MSEPVEELRAVVERTAAAPGDLAPYLAKVRERAYEVTDADVEQLLAAGHSQDELFERPSRPRSATGSAGSTQRCG
jgi:hypothetical protein